MALLLNLCVILVVSIVAMVVYDKFIHPALFKEELEETLEDAVETKARAEIQKKAKEIIGEDDVDSKDEQ